MDIHNHTIDEQKQILQDTDPNLHPHKAIEINNEIEKRKTEYGISLSILILAFLSISIYFCIASNGTIQTILSLASATIIFGFFALLCFYIPHKSIVLRIGRVLLSMSLAWNYWIGGGDEIILIMATIQIGMGFLMLSYGLLSYFTGIPNIF
jgi:hypothetical protein